MKKLEIIDFHCDTASLIYHQHATLRENSYHVDLQKMKKANYAAQWFAFFVHLESLSGQSPYEAFQQMYTYFVAEMNKNKDLIEIVTDYTGYCQCREAGKMAAFLSLEEGQVIEGRIDYLEDLIKKGIRLMTFTWNTPNALGYPHNMDKGLTQFGKEVAEYLNTTPVLLDISHLSETALKDIVTHYKKPIIASHSNARSFYFHTRNVSDEGIRIIADSGGVMGTNFYSHFLGNGEHTSIECLVNHIQMLYNLGGEDILALGTDFDGIDCTLEVCSCVEMDKLIDRLLKSFPSHVIEKLCFKNAERVIKENL